jgi:8-oxo-dGTP diphosphatase
VANPFESGARKAIPAVLVYLFKSGKTAGGSEQREVLMIHREGGTPPQTGQIRPVDYHSGKWNGLGGKCEADESPLETAHREIHEEAGLDLPLSNFKPLGVLQFPNFKPHKSEDWLVFVFSVEVDEVTAAGALKENPEGRLEWIPVDQLLSLNLWEGDRYFIPWVIQQKPFLGTFWYQDRQLARHWIVPFADANSQR